MVLSISLASLVVIGGSCTEFDALTSVLSHNEVIESRIADLVKLNVLGGLGAPTAPTAQGKCCRWGKILTRLGCQLGWPLCEPMIRESSSGKNESKSQRSLTLTGIS
jgi:hypothetical protein